MIKQYFRTFLCFVFLSSCASRSLFHYFFYPSHFTSERRHLSFTLVVNAPAVVHVETVQLILTLFWTPLFVTTIAARACPQQRLHLHSFCLNFLPSNSPRA